MTPSILAPARRGAFFGLVGFTAGEAVALAASAAAAQAAIAEIANGGGATWSLAGLAAAACAVAGFGWVRATKAEDFGMRYVNEVRLQLAQHAISSAANGRKRRIGSLTARMAGDLLALKQWASLGISDGAAAAASFVAGAIALVHMNQAFGALVVAMLLGLNMAVAAPVALALRRSWGRVRKERGRVAALVGDITLAGAAISRFAAADRELRRLRKRSEKLREASVRQRSLAAVLLAPGILTSAVAILAAALLPSLGWAPPQGVGGWAGYMFGVGLLSAAFTGMARALDAWLAFSMADERLKELAPQQASAPAPLPSEPASPRDAAGFVFSLAGAAYSIAPRTIALIGGAEAQALTHVAQIADRKGAAALDGAPLAELSDRNLARWCPLAAPETPLVRASVRRNLTLRARGASDARLKAILEIVGLEDLELTQGIDAEIGIPDANVQMRLRLARAMAQRARVIFVAEPLLLRDPATPSLLRRMAEHAGATIVCAYAGPPPPNLQGITVIRF